MLIDAMEYSAVIKAGEHRLCINMERQPTEKARYRTVSLVGHQWGTERTK